MFFLVTMIVLAGKLEVAHFLKLVEAHTGFRVLLLKFLEVLLQIDVHEVLFLELLPSNVSKLVHVDLEVVLVLELLLHLLKIFLENALSLLGFALVEVELLEGLREFLEDGIKLFLAVGNFSELEARVSESECSSHRNGYQKDH